MLALVAYTQEALIFVGFKDKRKKHEPKRPVSRFKIIFCIKGMVKQVNLYNSIILKAEYCKPIGRGIQTL